mmetsp:Transcript_71948/g.155391  ORF Transcript_71948/g.155391 Transcript_71948/m.155391 type:complete len:114 (-) Transcript_71948:1078-1419(-)
MGKEFTLTKSFEQAQKSGDKIISVFKAGMVAVTRENCGKTLLFNEVSKSNLDLLRKTIEDVFLPVFSRQTNLPTWSMKSRLDMIDKLSGFSVESKAIEGQIKGQTELPLPPKT